MSALEKIETTREIPSGTSTMHKISKSNSPGGGESYAWIKEHTHHQSDECIPWPFHRIRDGAGTLCVNGTAHYAHRLMCEMAHGPAPSPKHCASYLCEGRSITCMNPCHLGWRTMSEIRKETWKRKPRKTNRGTRTSLSQDTIEKLRQFRATHTKEATAKAFNVSVGVADYWTRQRAMWGVKGFFWNDEREAIVRDIASRAGGATSKQIMAALGAGAGQRSSIPRFLQKAGLTLRREPRVIVKRRPTLKLVDPRQSAYPFIRAELTDHHALLLEVNRLVSQGMPGREDVCQEILLALFEGTFTIEQLRAHRTDVRGFIRKFNKENRESGGYAISLDQPMYDGRPWHDVLVDPQSVRQDWQ